MGLHGHGLRIVERPISNFLPINGASYLKLGGGLERTQAEFAKFSNRDAEALSAYYAMLDEIGDVLRSLAQQTPPNLGDGLSGLMRACARSAGWRPSPWGARATFWTCSLKVARSFLDGWFDSEPVKAAFGFDAVVGNYASPDSPGSAYVMLHHTFGEVNGKKGAWGHAIGGMGAITQAMAKACKAKGVEILTDAPVRQVVVDGGKAAGVELADGRRVAATIVASNLNPSLLFLGLVAPADLPAEFRTRIARYRNGSGTFRMNLALSELPDFICLPGGRWRNTTSPASSSPRRSTTWTRRGASEGCRLVEKTDHRDADPIDPRRQPGPARPTCGQPVLPAVRAAASRRALVGRHAG